jgi:hypothetical protein
MAMNKEQALKEVEALRKEYLESVPDCDEITRIQLSRWVCTNFEKIEIGIKVIYDKMDCEIGPGLTIMEEYASNIFYELEASGINRHLNKAIGAILQVKHLGRFSID